MSERCNYNWNVGHWGPGVSNKITTVVVLLRLLTHVKVSVRCMQHHNLFDILHVFTINQF